MRFVYLICFIFFYLTVHAQYTDSLPKDSSLTYRPKNSFIYTDVYKVLIDSNSLVNVKGKPKAIPILIKRNDSETESFFYIITLLMLALGILKTLYSRYFSTLFRVFFNTSLRQNQLTDQLEQAKLPSLFFNLFFIIVAGIYVFLVLRFFSVQPEKNNFYFIGLCAAAVGFCYFIKYIFLRIIGGITEHSPEANSYIFIVFLLNKIIGISLMPFIILIALSNRNLATYALLTSAIILALMLLMRFYRSYSFLRSRLKISTLHFSIYILAFEVCPPAVIYKGAMLFFGIKV